MGDLSPGEGLRGRIVVDPDREVAPPPPGLPRFPPEGSRSRNAAPFFNVPAMENTPLALTAGSRLYST